MRKVLLSFRAAAVLSLFLLVDIFVTWWAKQLPFINLILELRTRYNWWRTQVSSLQFIGCIIFYQLFCFLCSALRSFWLSSQKLHCQFTQFPEPVPIVTFPFSACLMLLSTLPPPTQHCPSPSQPFLYSCSPFTSAVFPTKSYSVSPSVSEVSLQIRPYAALPAALVTEGLWWSWVDWLQWPWSTYFSSLISLQCELFLVCQVS